MHRYTNAYVHMSTVALAHIYTYATIHAALGEVVSYVNTRTSRMVVGRPGDRKPAFTYACVCVTLSQ